MGFVRSAGKDNDPCVLPYYMVEFLRCSQDCNHQEGLTTSDALKLKFEQCNLLCTSLRNV